VCMAKFVLSPARVARPWRAASHDGNVDEFVYLPIYWTSQAVDGADIMGTHGSGVAVPVYSCYGYDHG
jgi:hypothetical protein